MERWRQLLNGYALRQLSVAEEVELLEWIGDPANEQEVKTELESFIVEYPHVKALLPAASADEILETIFKMGTTIEAAAPVGPAHRVHFLKKPWLRYAAVFLLMAGGILYFFINSHSNSKITRTMNFASAALQPDVKPGGNVATLILADGRTILLDSAADGELAHQGATRVLKLDDGALAYQAEAAAGGEMLYNTIRTPRGGQYQIRLPDGTKVWLNAATSLKFPVSFKGADRRDVEVSGEAYFEVAADKDKPFYVKSGQGLIQVLGTSFNVNAYEDENGERATLLSGRIKVAHGNSAVLLSPGEQAVVNGDISVNRNADAEQVLAWKNGLFNFRDKNLHDVMRQLSRWYNIDVQYENDVPDIVFEGEMTRNENLGFVLKTLQNFGVHFRMEEGKRLVVMP